MKFKINNVEVQFPYQPYEVQTEFMTKVINVLENKMNALLESPTGTGKTLSLLCATLAWQSEYKDRQLQFWKEVFESEKILPLKLSNKQERQKTEIFECLQKGNTKALEKILTPPKIFYSTRTHSQISQVIKELKKTSYRPRSRNHYCIHKDVSKSPSINDDCIKLIKESQCRMFKNAELMQVSTDFKPGGKFEVWDMEDLISEGKSRSSCPYFASQYMIENANIVFCPYNYILDPNIRSSTNIDLTDSIVIFDEAHNIEDISRSCTSYSGTNRDFDCKNHFTDPRCFF